MADIVNVSFTTAPNNNKWVEGESGSDELMGQSFAPVGTILCPQIDINVGQGSTSPGDSLELRVEAVVGGLPNGSLVHANATKTILGSSLPANFGWHAYIFAIPFTLADAVQRAIVLKRTGARDVVNHYAFMVNTAGGYAGGVALGKNSGTWSDISGTFGDFNFRVYERELGDVKKIAGVAKADIKVFANVPAADIKKVSGVEY